MNRQFSAVSRARSFLLLSTVALAMLAGCTMQPRPGGEAESGGIDNGRGACIGDAQGEDICAFAIGILEDKKEQPVAVLVRELVDYDESDHPNWRVRDRVAVPRERRDLHLEQGSCRLDGTADATIVALVPFYDERGAEWIGAQEWAYRVELPSARFVQLEPARVDCHNAAIEAD